MREKQKTFRAYVLVSQLGISILVPILLCTGVGYWVEEHYHLPVFIPLILLGVAAGVRNAWVLLQGYLRDTEDKKKRY